MWLIKIATYLAISVIVAILIFLVHQENMSLIEAEMRTANTLEAWVAKSAADQRRGFALQQSQLAGLQAKVQQTSNTLKTRHELELQHLKTRFATLEAEMRQNATTMKAQVAAGVADQKHAIVSQFTGLEAEVQQTAIALKAGHTHELQRLESRFAGLERSESTRLNSSH